MDELRQSGAHLLIGDDFAFGLGHAVFLDPFYLLGGVLWRLGLSVGAAFWALKLLAAPALAIAAVALACRLFASLASRLAVVALALFYFSPVNALLLWRTPFTGLSNYAHLVPASEANPAWQLWGQPHAALTIATLTAAILGSVSVALGNRSRALLLALCGSACITGWLHPWQGATFILVALALALVLRDRRVAITLAAPIVATAAPMIYEAVLAHTDAAWRVDSARNAVPHGQLWILLAALLPLALAAVAGVRNVPRGAWRVALVAWPCATVAVYFATSQFPDHALQGISLPLAVLAVAAWRSLITVRGSSVLGALAILAATVPGLAFEFKLFRDTEAAPATPYVLNSSEAAALNYLDHLHTPGGVLSREYLGAAVPAFTGRKTWVGQWTWTPDYNRRVALANQLVDGEMGASRARQFVAHTGAGFVLSDCRTRAPLRRLLGPLVESGRRFGCAAVYRLAGT
jgi:hypothetical protein